LDPGSQLYVAVIDTNYAAEPYHCIMKTQWMDDLSRFPYVDGVEFYSVTSYEQAECQLRVVTVPRSRHRSLNPSSHLLFQTLKAFLLRSSAGWLFVINDAAYVRVPNLDAFLRSSLERQRPAAVFARGSCVERRFYFQMLSITSGILISRRAVERLIDKEETWNVTIEIGLPAEEALSQILDGISVTARWSKKDDFLGQPFRHSEFRQRLLDKRFDGLVTCQRPNANSGSSGIATVCSTEFTKVNDLVVWAGAGNNATDKEWFLKNARDMLRDVPDHVHFIWDRLFPELCTR
jgi:hypothetical protein